MAAGPWKSLWDCVQLPWTILESTKLNCTILLYFGFLLLGIAAMLSCAEGRVALLQTKRYLWSFRASEDTRENEQISRGSVIGHRGSVISSEMLVWS